MKLKKWKNPLEIPQKYQNYHNCTINVASTIFRIFLLDIIFEKAPFIMSILPSEIADIVNEVRSARDIIEANFVKIFAEKGNFTLKTVTDKSIAQIEFITTTFRDTPYKHFSMAYYQEEYILMVTPAEAYSSYEKLLLPFDITTWALLITTFAISFLVIVIVNRMPDNFQMIVYGYKVQTPSLNVLRGFFGSSQVKLPSNNFARIILLLFLYFCLVFRTAYQG